MLLIRDADIVHGRKLMAMDSRTHTVHDEAVKDGANNVLQLSADADMAPDRAADFLDADELDEEQIRPWTIVEDDGHRRLKIAAKQ